MLPFPMFARSLTRKLRKSSIFMEEIERLRDREIKRSSDQEIKRLRD
jgi:hypothetical protein